MPSNEKNPLLTIFEKKPYKEEDKKLLELAIIFLEKKETKNIEKILEISKYLEKNKFKKELIISALIFMDSEKIDFPQIKKDFGEEVFLIISNQKRLEEILGKSKIEKGNFPREEIISSMENLESIILHLAMKLVELKINGNKRNAQEIMENEIHLATRLGLERIKKDLADEAFKILNPKKYSEISNFLKMSKKERETLLNKMLNELEKKIKTDVKNLTIKGREKQIYSIYEKMTKRKVPLNKQKDQFGIRIITKNEKDCYLIFEILSREYSVLEETIKDYIKKPKENGYQSLHFCIKYDEKIVEIQVRTKEMDEFAEEGGAAHWAYKKIKSNEKFEKKTAWLKEILKLKEKKSSFLQDLKLNLFKDKIYCYTPKGKSISLPLGSSVLDFAYQIHAEIGNHSTGGKINGKFISLKTELSNGDTVEIITNKFQRPRRAWLKFVKTKSAKKMISREVKKYENIPVPKTFFQKKDQHENQECPVEIKEFPEHLVNFARCCNPLPDDEIVGIIRSYKKAVIHKKKCERIKNREVGFKAEWKEMFESPIKIFVQTSDRSGILADILNTISRKNFKVKEANAKLVGNNLAECYFLVSSKTKYDLMEIISRIKKIRDVKKIWFD